MFVKQYTIMLRELEEQRAQISIELIIVLAAVVAVVLLLVTQLQETSKEGTKVIDAKTKKIFKEIDDI